MVDKFIEEQKKVNAYIDKRISNLVNELSNISNLVKDEIKKSTDKQKFANLEIEKRLVKLETNIDEIKSMMPSLKPEVKSIESSLARSMKEEFDAMLKKELERIDKQISQLKEQSMAEAEIIASMKKDFSLHKDMASKEDLKRMEEMLPRNVITKSYLDEQLKSLKHEIIEKSIFSDEIEKIKNDIKNIKIFMQSMPSEKPGKEFEDFKKDIERINKLLDQLKKENVSEEEMINVMKKELALPDNVLLKEDLKKIEDKIPKNVASKQDLIDLRSEIEGIISTIDIKKFAFKDDLERLKLSLEGKIPSIDLEKIATKRDLADLKLEVQSAMSTIDLNKFATKDDIKELKAQIPSIDINKFATKEDIKELKSEFPAINVSKFVTKDDINLMKENIIKDVDSRTAGSRSDFLDFRQSIKKEIKDALNQQAIENERFKNSILSRIATMETRVPSSEALIKIANIDKILEKFRMDFIELSRKLEESIFKDIESMKKELALPSDIIRSDDLNSLYSEIDELNRKVQNLQKWFVVSRMAEPLILE